MESIQVVLLIIVSSILMTPSVSLPCERSYCDDNDISHSKPKLVSVVFRHGDRAPDPIERYPTDPYYNHSFYPEGLGGLTNQGKLREYKLGELLRRKYRDFLGDVYLPESVSARSTDYKRTKMCLQLVLAALYPPQHKQVWKEDLPWQPIPMNYAPSSQDWLMIPEECPEYLKERQIAEEMPEVQHKIKSFKNFMTNLTQLTGKNISTPFDMYNLYHILVAESYMNLTLPEWTKDIFPYGKLLDGIELEYEIFSYTKNMRRLNGGKLLYDMIEQMLKVEQGLMDKNRRINLYSGHETNIAAVLQSLGVYKPHVPEYTSAVILELVQTMDTKYYVQIFYYRGIPEALERKRIPGCDYLCSLDKFVDLLQDVIPSSDELLCNKNKKL